MIRNPTSWLPRARVVLVASTTMALTSAAGEVAAACGSTTSGSAGKTESASGAAGSGRLLETGDQSLNLRDRKTGEKRITHVNRHLPYSAWSTDGSTLLCHGTGGLYQPAPDGGTIKRIDQGSVHGQISWLQR